MFTPTTILKTMFVSGIIPKRIEFLDLYKYSKIKKIYAGEYNSSCWKNRRQKLIYMEKNRE